jgi:hypothetical protein
VLARSDTVVFSAIIEDDPSAYAQGRKQACPFKGPHQPMGTKGMVCSFQ